jgi:hypothetical protein
MMTRLPELNKGDDAWAVYRGIAIKCKVLDVEDHWAKKHPDGIYFYWLDEPIGHSLPADELFLNREDAKKELLRLWDDEDPFDTDEEKEDHLNASLDLWREIGTDFIIKSHEQSNHEHPGWEDGFMPPKKPDEDWFNIAMVLQKS